MRLPYQSATNRIIDLLICRLHRAAEHRWSRAVRRGLLTCLPLVMLGAAAVLFNHLPISGYQQLMGHFFGPGWKHFFELIWQATFGVIAVAMVIAISHALTIEHPRARPDNITPAIVSAVALASFFTLIHTDSPASFVTFLGNRGAFTAICTAILATEVFLWLSHNNLTPVRWFGHDVDPALPNALVALLPGALTILLFFVLGQLIGLIPGIFGNQLGALLLAPFANPEHLGLGAMVMLLLIHLLWFFGIHGNIALDPLAQTHFSAAHASNLPGFIPHEVFSKTFYDVFIYQGGAGCTLSLLLAALLIRSRTGSRRIAKVALPCALINVNEPVLFGFPVVLNPFYLVPFLLTPLALFASGALLIGIGIVPPPTVQVEWTTPPLLGGWIATGSWRGAALQLFQLALGTLIYLPFVRLAEKAREMQNTRAFNALIEEVRKENSRIPHELVRQDDIGNLARLLAADLLHDIGTNRLYLAYQPMTDHAGKTLGVEALLRWQHPVYGQVPPFLAIHLAEENGSIIQLGRWVTREACRQLGQWRREGIENLRMSINLSPRQLCDTGLATCLREAIADNHLDARNIELEITETCEIGGGEAEKDMFTQLTTCGVRLAMDDFGMGYSSILYMRRFPISTIKIDGSLTRDVLNDPNCREIILSMATLCRTTHVEVVAEHVETREQLKTLYTLGCQVFQGFLFSRPLPPEKCADFIRTSRKK